MKKTAVFLYPQFSEYELSVALSVLMQGQKEVVMIGLTGDPVTGESGLTALPQETIDSMEIDTLDSLLLPGCMDIGILKDETKIFDFISELDKRGAKIAAISSAGFLLAKAGVLKDKKYTVGLSREQRDFIGIFNEDLYRDELVVQDGRILTARGRGFIEFGVSLGHLLELEFDHAWYKS